VTTVMDDDVAIQCRKIALPEYQLHRDSLQVRKNLHTRTQESDICSEKLGD
jgi:hypothetical protein